jgi:hypothetical protein
MDDSGAELTALAREPDGQIVVAGTARGPISFAGVLRGGRGESDAIAAKLTCDGTLAWLQRFGSFGTPPGSVVFNDIAVDQGSLHLAGGYDVGALLDLPVPVNCQGIGSEAMLVELAH